MRVRLTRRLGQNQAGSVLDYRDSEGEWLVGQGHAVPEVRYLDAQDPLPNEVAVDPAVDTTNEGPSLKELQAKAEGMGLKTYGSKAQLAARIAMRESAGT